MEKGTNELIVDTKALHSPRQTTIILSVPVVIGNTDIRCPNLTDAIRDASFGNSVESRMSVTQYSFSFIR